MANLELIRQLCIDKKITIRELAKRIDKKENTVQSMITSGSTSILTLEAIAKVLGVSPAIFWDSPKPVSELEIELKYLKDLISEKDQIIKEKERMIEYFMANKK